MQWEEALESALKSYGHALVAVGQAGADACPPVGEELSISLLNLSQRLNAEASIGAITETEQSLEKALKAWSARAAQFYDEKTNDVREILTLVAKATGQLGERDQGYAQQFGDLAARLKDTAKLNDLTTIRKSLVVNVAALETSVTKMKREGAESVAELRAQVKLYETRLDEVERIANQDELTGLANRRKVERQLELRAHQGSPFCVLYMDLNEFKQVNDTLGQAAGDDLLKQFAGELRMAFRAADLVGRWGGDEFIVLLEGDFRDSQARVDQIRRWIVGEYIVTTESGPRKVQVSAASGFASWQPNDTPTTILQRTDAAMYEQKVGMKCRGKLP